MPSISFSYVPTFNQAETEVKSLAPCLEYRVEIPDNATLFVDDVYYHVNAWLRGLGYVISDED